MDSIWEILGGGFAFLCLLFGVLFFSFIGLTSLYEVFQKSIWNNFKQIIYEKFSSIILMLLSFALVYVMGGVLIGFFI
jgi:hypothetical protein|tara:strand:+ start:303 stop:536 length:234 start_codon:yes stop_codon:yes gene_type:complete